MDGSQDDNFICPDLVYPINNEENKTFIINDLDNEKE